VLDDAANTTEGHGPRRHVWAGGLYARECRRKSQIKEDVPKDYEIGASRMFWEGAYVIVRQRARAYTRTHTHTKNQCGP
jgi:hypothetical protein